MKLRKGRIFMTVNVKGGKLSKKEIEAYTTQLREANPDKYIKIGFTGRLHLWWPLLLCRAIANGFHPTTHKVSLQTSKAIILPKTRASCYSHHLSQYALRETN